jgi:hypothetical protein
VAAGLFHADRQADIMKLNVILQNFANMPKKPKSLNMARKTEIKDILMSGTKNWVVFKTDTSSYFILKQNSKCLATFCVLQW